MSAGVLALNLSVAFPRHTDASGSLVGLDDRAHVELDQVTPPLAPAIEEGPIVRFHELEATVKPVVIDDPAVNVPNSLGQHPAMSCSAFVHGPWPINVALNNHVEHRRTLSGRPARREREVALPLCGPVAHGRVPS
jgi:hypothetical protein